MHFKELEQEMDAWTSHLSTLSARISQTRKRTWLLPCAGVLRAAEVREGKFLHRWQVPLPEGYGMAEAAAALRALQEQGLHDKSLFLLADFPSLRVEVKKFPDMTAEEFQETLYWEQDRIFYGGDTMALACRVLSHSAEGYVGFLHGVPADVLDLWKDAAGEAGFHLTAAVPVTDISLVDGPSFTLYVRRFSAILVYRSGRRVETRVLKLVEPGKGALFFRHILGRKEMADVPLILVPLADADGEKLAEWQAWMQKEIRTFQEGPEEDGPAGEEAMMLEEIEGGHPRTSITLEGPPLSGDAGWQAVLPLFLRADTAEAQISFSAEAPFEKEERRPLRIVQGLTVVAGLFCLLSAGQYLLAVKDFHQAEERSAALSPQRAALEEQQKNRRQEEADLALLRKLLKEDPHWEQKLVTLADTMPDGVVLKGLRSENRSAVVHIEGTAQTGDALALFRQRLQGSWGGRVRLEKQKRNTLTHLIEFTVEWKKGEEEK